MLNSKYLIPVAIVIAGIIIAGAILYAESPKKELSLTLPEKKKEELADRFEIEIKKEDHIRGDFSAPVTILEYSDFQCPFCARFHPVVQQILSDYPGEVRWVYKHFPIDQIHAQARPAAEASECVWEQKGNNVFWQFTDLLLENQEGLDKEFYKELAQNLGLNLEQFEDCINSRKYKDKVEADYQEGIKAGVKGTPGSFVNGEEISGAVPYEYLKDAVEKALGNL